MYGKITVGFGTSAERELDVVSYVSTKYKDNRLVSVSELEDGSFVGVVENPASTGRNPQSIIWLSKESFIGLISTAIMYLNMKKEDVEKLLEEAVSKEAVEYSYSDNLSDFLENEQ